MIPYFEQSTFHFAGEEAGSGGIWGAILNIIIVILKPPTF
jgi:hypothetical protein